MKTMKAKRRMLIAACILFAVIFTLGAAAAETTGKVHGGWLILRSAPAYSGKKISSYPVGTVVTINGKSGSWYAVTTLDGLTGYMLSKYLTVSGNDLIAGESAWVTSSNGLNVRLRAGNGTQYKAVASYAPGTKCTVLEKGDKFCKIKIGTLTGYMMTKFLSSVDPGTPSGGTVQYDVYVVSSNGRGVNLRSSPYKGNNVIGFYNVGTKAGMITPGVVWSLISVDGREGYMMTQFLSKNKEEPVSPSTGSYVISYNGKNVNLRTGPGLNYPILGSFPPGTPLSVLKTGSTWYQIKINGIYGYMMEKYIITK